MGTYAELLPADTNTRDRCGGARCRRIHVPLGQVCTRSIFFFSHDNSPDVLSDPDDSYQIRETTKVKKAKNINSSGDIGAFFSKPLAPAVDPEEDIVMNEDRVATTSMNSSG